MATKDKGKAAISVSKYSAPDRAILFSFYNHPQPLWVWADGTSISLEKLNLHVDDEWRIKANIKREVSNPKEGVRKKGQEPEPPKPCRGERLLEWTWFISVWVPWLTTIWWPRPNLSSPRSTNYIVWALNVRTQHHFGVVTNFESLQLAPSVGKVCALAQAVDQESPSITSSSPL